MIQQDKDGLGTQPKTGGKRYNNPRHQVIADILGHKLSESELQQALRICDEEFATDQAFSASKFCARFTASTPSVTLGKQTRILFLQNARFPSDAGEPTTSMGAEKAASASPPRSTWTLHTQTENGAERRKSPRKFTNLNGSCIRLEDKQKRIPVVVENLSVTGSRIRLQPGCELKRDELIRIEFKLDDAWGTFIRSKGEVRWALSDLAGIEFICPEDLPESLTDYTNS